MIYGNRSMPDWNMTYAPAAGVRHELSHHAIHMRCGTIEPEAVMQNGVNRTEGVTNSYAVKYMGANRALIQQSIDYAASTGHKQYRMDAFTDRAAERIHSGSNRAGFWSLIAFRGGASGSFGHLSAFRGVGARVEPGRKPHDSNAGCPRILRISRLGNPLKRR